MTNVLCPACRWPIWPWSQTLRLIWNYKFFRQLHMGCAVAFRRRVPPRPRAPHTIHPEVPMKTVLCAVAFVLLATTAHANILIQTVEVDVGTGVWCDTSSVTGACATAAHPWNLGGGILLTNGQTLVLTQTAGFNFDTSDRCEVPGCSMSRVVINGISFTDAQKILAGQGPGHIDTGSTANNEAAEWTPLGGVAAFTVSAGYADNEHTGPCADASHDCRPDSPWTDATRFLGLGTVSNIGSACTTSASCFDAGAVLIRAVPVPATWLLMGLGLLVGGLGLRRRGV